MNDQKLNKCINYVSDAIEQGPAALYASFMYIIKENERLQNLLSQRKHQPLFNCAIETIQIEKSLQKASHNHILSQKKEAQQENTDNIKKKSPLQSIQMPYVPHPLIGCLCSVCKLLFATNSKKYPTFKLIIKIQCLNQEYDLQDLYNETVLYKNKFLCKIIYVGHSRNNEAHLDKERNEYGIAQPKKIGAVIQPFSALYNTNTSKNEFFVSLGNIMIIPNSKELRIPNKVNSFNNSTLHLSQMSDSISCHRRYCKPTSESYKELQSFSSSENFSSERKTFSPPRNLHSDRKSFSPPRSLHSDRKSFSPPRSLHSDRKSFSPPRSFHSDRKIFSPPRSLHSDCKSFSPPGSLHSDRKSFSPPRNLHSDCISFSPSQHCISDRRSFSPSRILPSNQYPRCHTKDRRSYSPSRNPLYGLKEHPPRHSQLRRESFPTEYLQRHFNGPSRTSNVFEDRLDPYYRYQTNYCNRQRSDHHDTCCYRSSFNYPCGCEVSSSLCPTPPPHYVQKRGSLPDNFLPTDSFNLERRRLSEETFDSAISLSSHFEHSTFV